ncbi:MAG: substrate-binding domain-containing protein, partial [Gimesia sp.]
MRLFCNHQFALKVQPSFRTGKLNSGLAFVGGSLVFLIVMVAVLIYSPPKDTSGTSNSNQQTAQDTGKSAENESLTMYCAAGIKPPVAAAAAQFAAEEYGIPIHLQYGGSGTLLSNLQVAKKGDLYLAADTSYIEIAREKNLLKEA